jgi:hypothetical protein
MEDRPAREVIAVLAGQDREAGVHPQVGRQHAHRVVMLVPTIHQVGVEDTDPGELCRGGGRFHARVVEPVRGEQQVEPLRGESEAAERVGDGAMPVLLQPH